jgi:hypothetical protein
MFPPRRKKLISKWINQKGSRTIGYLLGSKEEPLPGHRAVRPGVTGFKIGPLTLCRRRADCTAIVVKLVRHDIIEKNNNNNSENPVSLLTFPNLISKPLDPARRNGMKKISETARACITGLSQACLPLDRIYRVTILEIG